MFLLIACASTALTGTAIERHVDENDDGRRDTVADFYEYDTDGDGTADRIVDWVDVDEDGEADRQLILSLPGGQPGPRSFGFLIEEMKPGPATTAAGARRTFWPVLDGVYIQPRDQFHCDFHGDLFFTYMKYDSREAKWVVQEENPYCFYDPDGDGLSEESLRFAGLGPSISSIRWSFDCDNDGSLDRGKASASPTHAGERSNDRVTDRANDRAADREGDRANTRVDDHATDRVDYSGTYDYDLSLTATGRARVPAALSRTIPVRGEDVITLLDWSHARDYAKKAVMLRSLLAFDENDRNVDVKNPETGERWEGVIAKVPPGFSQIGNPNCGTANKRYELRNVPSHFLEIYFSPVDGRIHLKGAGEGWIEIDRDDDGTIDARLEMQDRSGDGTFDTWFWDGDKDGVYEHAYRKPEGPEWDPIPVAIDFHELHRYDSLIRERTGLEQGERFRAEVELWSALGRFVPIDSLKTAGAVQD